VKIIDTENGDVAESAFLSDVVEQPPMATRTARLMSLNLFISLPLSNKKACNKKSLQA
jgi:hypothetical protein